MLAACSDRTPTAPATSYEPALKAHSAVTPTGKHLVFFDGQLSDAFDAKVAALGGTVDAEYGEVGIAVVSGLTPDEAAQLASEQGVTSVDPDGEFPFLEQPGMTVVESTDGSVESPTAPQTAFFYPRQWHLRAINANVAWAAGFLGSPSVRVAILDTGLDYLHADLNGRVDLANSASFVPSDDAIVAALFPTRHPVTDLHYHGTHVGATVSSNAIAAAGVTSQTTLMGVKVLSRTGSGSTSGILGGMIFATDRGADIINMSLGIAVLLDEKDKEIKAFKKMTDRVFQYAHKKGVMVIVSAGNEALNLDTKHSFKAYCSSKHVTCVSATGPTSQAGVNGPWTNIDAPASYSNFGVRDVDVSAPGGNGNSAVWAACSSSSLAIPVCQTGTFVVGISGTSMATPHASGVAALILSQRGDISSGQLESTLENTSDDLGPTGKDPRYGRGRVNAASALGL
jgi:subtilisin family serine protease